MSGQKISGVPAEVFRREVQPHEAEHGICSARMFVDAARPEDSPIHNAFEWDDSIAAERHRVEHGRRLIRTIKVVVNDKEHRAPAFLAVTRPEAGPGLTHGYVSTQIALTGRDRESVLRDALAQLNALRRRFSALNELADVWEAVDVIAETERMVA